MRHDGDRELYWSDTSEELIGYNTVKVIQKNIKFDNNIHSSPLLFVRFLI